MRRDVTLLVVSLLVASLLVAPTAVASEPTTYEPCEFPLTVTDATGEEITLEEPPERVTTTNPSAAQTMWEIGGESQVVGLTQYAMYLDGAEERTDVSADFGVSVEEVVATEPDLVLAPNASADAVEPLREAGLTVYHFPEATDIQSVQEKTTTMGALTGNCEGAAAANAWVDANLAEIDGVTADVEEPPRVLQPLGGGWVVADGTFINELLVRSGADNVAAHDHVGYVQLSDEVVLEADPEVLVVTHEQETLIEEEPYASTTAGQEGNTVTVRTEHLHQPAPRSIVYGAHNMTAQLHPERYGDDAYVPRSAIVVEPAETSPEDGTESIAEAETTPEPTTEGDSSDDISIGYGPGFGAVTALVAVVIGTILATRRQ